MQEFSISSERCWQRFHASTDDIANTERIPNEESSQWKIFQWNHCRNDPDGRQGMETSFLAWIKPRKIRFRFQREWSKYEDIHLIFLNQVEKFRGWFLIQHVKGYDTNFLMDLRNVEMVSRKWDGQETIWILSQQKQIGREQINPRLRSKALIPLGFEKDDRRPSSRHLISWW